MPYRCESTNIAGTMLDRRRKLTDSDKEEIRNLYKSGVISIHSLAKKYNVSRRTIQLAVSPERREKQRQYVKENWRKYVDREALTKYARDLRHYKKKLCDEGVIIMTKADKQKIYSWAAALSDEQLEKECWDLSESCLGSTAEKMYDMGYDYADIKEQELFEKRQLEKLKIIEDLCYKRGIKLYE